MCVFAIRILIFDMAVMKACLTRACVVCLRPSGVPVLVAIQYLVGFVTDELSVSFYSFSGLAADGRKCHYDQSR